MQISLLLLMEIAFAKAWFISLFEDEKLYRPKYNPVKESLCKNKKMNLFFFFKFSHNF